ncbi:hypothetical protein [Roseisolibacter agri]|uniref:Uncharacterized protein n=1 Tax=Roseisolibacter agri TaxID=2014610 RepID=A0AA37Q160_9BACT|nr:hypothetical protein [Roseisolibacter agri]GLC24604.1 hypothetical protein rosag_11170 [Roseisolibacter agri]
MRDTIWLVTFLAVLTAATASLFVTWRRVPRTGPHAWLVAPVAFVHLNTAGLALFAASAPLGIWSGLHSLGVLYHFLVALPASLWLASRLAPDRDASPSHRLAWRGAAYYPPAALATLLFMLLTSSS